jgi:hypothetical protein
MNRGSRITAEEQGAGQDTAGNMRKWENSVGSTIKPNAQRTGWFSLAPTLSGWHNVMVAKQVTTISEAACGIVVNGWRW